MPRRSRKLGFSILEIFVVVLIVAVLVTIVVLVVKPSKVLEKSRDAQRFQDMENISKAINSYLADNRNFAGIGGTYSSISPTFKNNKDREQVNGKGWIPIDFTIMSTGSPMQKLPIDPLNNTKYNYRVGIAEHNGTYEINCVYETDANILKHLNDGGNSVSDYETGTDLTIL